MIHSGWLFVAGIVGACLGAFIMAIVSAGAWSDRELNYFTEIQHLRDEIKHLKKDLA